MSLRDQVRAMTLETEALILRLENSKELHMPWAQAMLKRQLAAIEVLMKVRTATAERRDAEIMKQMITPHVEQKH